MVTITTGIQLQHEMVNTVLATAKATNRQEISAQQDGIYQKAVTNPKSPPTNSGN